MSFSQSRGFENAARRIADGFLNCKCAGEGSLPRPHSRSIATSCRAVLLPRFGGPEALVLRDNVEVPDLKPDEVLVRARAVSINPLDTRPPSSSSPTATAVGMTGPGGTAVQGSGRTDPTQPSRLDLPTRHPSRSSPDQRRCRRSADDLARSGNVSPEVHPRVLLRRPGRLLRVADRPVLAGGRGLAAGARGRCEVEGRGQGFRSQEGDRERVLDIRRHGQREDKVKSSSS